MGTDIRDILPPIDGRALVVGMSGTGKSTLMRGIMRAIERSARVLVTDPKAEWPPARYTLITRPQEFRFEFRYPILFRPPAQEFDNPDVYDPLFQEVWRRKDMTVYNDEIMFMGNRPTRYMRAIMAQGRSRNIRIINGTQRPKWIPKVTITEANTFYAFHLSDSEDIRAIRQMIPEYDPREIDVSRHEFYFKRLGKPARIMRYEYPGR
jgi:DNA helicase HerA-like ATPase